MKTSNYNKKLISIIIVNWNGENVIRDCLDSIVTQIYKNIEVIVVDNNSTDASKEIINKSFKKVKLIENKENVGFAEGNNIGSKYAKGEYILLLNNDTIVTKDFLTKLFNVIDSDDSIGVVQPKILYRQKVAFKKEAINSIGAFFTATGFLYYPGYLKNPDLEIYNKQREIFSAYGACMLIRSSIIKNTGLFDPDFFVYFEETDFCFKVLLQGKKIIYVPNSVIYHKGGISARKYGNSGIFFHAFKNRLCSYIKNLEYKNLALVLPSHIVISELTSIMYLMSGKFDLFFAIQKSFLWNLININKTFSKRKLIQKEIRKVRDFQYLTNLWKNPRMSYYYYLFKGLEGYKD